MNPPKKLFWKEGVISAFPQHRAAVYLPEQRVEAALILLDGLFAEDLAERTGYSVSKCQELLSILRED